MMTTAEIFTIIGASAGIGVGIVAAILSVVFRLVNQINHRIDDLRAEMTRALTVQKDATNQLREDTNRQFTDMREDMNRQFTEQKDALREQKDATNRQFTELREDMNRRFEEQGARMDRMEAQHGELVGEVHRMSKRLGRIDMMLELLTQRRPSVRQMFRRRAGDAA